MRPLIGFIVGILCATYIADWTLSFALSATVICFVSWQLSEVLSFGFKNLTSSLLILLTFVGLGSWVYMANAPSRSSNYFGHLTTEDTEAELIVTVLEPSKTRTRTKTLVHVDAILHNDRFIKTDGQLVCYFPKGHNYDQVILPGVRFVIRGYIRGVDKLSNPHSFDYKTYLANRGIGYQIFVNDTNNFTWISADNLSIWQQSASELRQWGLDVFAKYFVDNNQAILSAMVLGYRHQLDQEVYQRFVNTGAVHVLAVSGMHVGVVCLVFMFLLDRWKRDDYIAKSVKLITVLSIVWMYAFVTGASPAVIRASIMFSIFSIARSFFTHHNTFNIIAFTALIMLFYNPNQLYQAGFQFSFVSLVSILIFHPHLNRIWQPKAKWAAVIWNLIIVAVAAQILVFPITVYFFHRFPNYFILSGILGVPLAVLLLKMGLLLLAIEAFNLETINNIYAKLVSLVCDLFDGIIAWINSFPLNSSDGLWLSGWQVFVIYAIAFGGILLLQHDRRGLFIALGGVLVLMVSFLPDDEIPRYQLVVYDSFKGGILDIIVDDKVFSSFSSALSEEDISFIARPYRWSQKVQMIDTLMDYNESGIVSIGGRAILILNGSASWYPEKVDMVVVRKEAAFDPKAIVPLYDATYILESDIDKWVMNKWVQHLENKNLKYHLVSNEAAIIAW